MLLPICNLLLNWYWYDKIASNIGNFFDWILFDSNEYWTEFPNNSKVTLFQVICFKLFLFQNNLDVVFNWQQMISACKYLILNWFYSPKFTSLDCWWTNKFSFNLRNLASNLCKFFLSFHFNLFLGFLGHMKNWFLVGVVTTALALIQPNKNFWTDIWLPWPHEDWTDMSSFDTIILLFGVVTKRFGSYSTKQLNLLPILKIGGMNW